MTPNRIRMNRTGSHAPRTAQGGFSLIEIIIVVLLIAGVVAFAANRIMGGGDRAKVNLAKAQVQTLAEKVQQFEADTGALPDSLDDLVQSDAAGWLGPYAKTAELKDPWNNEWDYKLPGDNRPFDLVSYGKDGKPGGTSVDADITNP
jgi:general secretion pathway protein G